MSGALSWTNLFTIYGDVPELQTSATSASVDSAYPVANMLDEDPSRVTRINYTNSTGSNATVLLRTQVSAANDAGIRVMALLNVRLASHVVSCGVQVVNLAQSVALFSASFSAASFVPIPGTQDRYNFYFIVPAGVGDGAYVDFIFTIPTGTVDYGEIGFMWAGPAIVWPNGAGVEWSMDVEDRSTVERGNSGSYAAYRYNRLRVLSVTKRGMDYAEALGSAGSTLSIRDAMLSAGISAPVVVISTDSDTHKAQTMSVYGLVDAWSALGHQGAYRFGIGARVKEIR